MSPRWVTGVVGVLVAAVAGGCASDASDEERVAAFCATWAEVGVSGIDLETDAQIALLTVAPDAVDDAVGTLVASTQRPAGPRLEAAIEGIESFVQQRC